MVRIMFILQSVGEPARLAEPVGMTRLTIWHFLSHLTVQQPRRRANFVRGRGGGWGSWIVQRNF